MAMHKDRHGIADALQRLATSQDRVAWSVLMERCGPATERLARRLCGDVHAAQDALQEAWLQIRDGAVRFQPMGSDPDAGAWGWVMRVTANACLKWNRRQRSQRVVRLTGTHERAAPVEDVAMDPEVAADIRQSLARLPEEQRTAVVLHVIEGIDFATLAVSYGCSVAAIKMRVYRGIERLREHLPATTLHSVAVPALLVELPMLTGRLDVASLKELLVSPAKATLSAAPAAGGTTVGTPMVMAGGFAAVVLICAVTWATLAPRKGAHTPTQDRVRTPPVTQSRLIATQPTLALTVERAILQLGDPAGMPASTRLSVKAIGFTADSALTFTWRQVRDEMSPLAANISAGGAVRLSGTTGVEITATFPSPGVYAIQVTGSDGFTSTSVSRLAWVNVWPSRSPILVDGLPDPLTVPPGIRPPPRVRDLTPDPGPFQHPRLFCGDQEWAEINRRAVRGEGRIAGAAFKALVEQSAALLDAGSPRAALLDGLRGVATNGFTGPLLDLVRDRPVATAKAEIQDFAGALADAAFVRWALNDPAEPLPEAQANERVARRRVAAAVAGLSHTLLASWWDRERAVFTTDHPLFPVGFDQPGQPFSATDVTNALAIAYDFSAAWMTSGERRATCEFLLATGTGRRSGNDRFVRTINGVLENRGIPRGLQQVNPPSDQVVLAALVVAGEESAADPRVVHTFLEPQSPQGLLRKQMTADDWTMPVTYDGGGAYPGSRPYGPTLSWPHARKADADNLQRALWWHQDGMVSPWGSIGRGESDLAVTANGLWPEALAFARQGAHNQFVTGTFYQVVNHIIYGRYVRAGEQAAVAVPLRENHGLTSLKPVYRLLLKYMYPDDPAVDYCYAGWAEELERRPTMWHCLFGLDPDHATQREALSAVAAAKRLPLTRIDPEVGLAVLRSDWSDDATVVDLDGSFSQVWHRQAARNSFTLVALGRTWSAPAAAALTSQMQSGILVQQSDFSSCSLTHGYLGQNPNVVPQSGGDVYGHPGVSTPPGRLVAWEESPDREWSVVVGDATAAYGYRTDGPRDAKRIAFDWAPYLAPGLVVDLTARCPLFSNIYVHNRDQYYGGPRLGLRPAPETALRHALRSVLLVRGKRPYVLIVDDVQKDDARWNYRWVMNNADKAGDGEFALAIADGASATQAILCHRDDAAETPGNPRLLVRELARGDVANQPAMRMEEGAFPRTHDAPQGDLVRTKRLVLERRQVIEPTFTVLLFPHRVGEELPLTTWNTAGTELTVDLRDGAYDVITAKRRPGDPRTRLSVRRL